MQIDEISELPSNGPRARDDDFPGKDRRTSIPASLIIDLKEKKRRRERDEKENVSFPSGRSSVECHASYTCLRPEKIYT